MASAAEIITTPPFRPVGRFTDWEMVVEFDHGHDTVKRDHWAVHRRTGERHHIQWSPYSDPPSGVFYLLWALGWARRADAEAALNLRLAGGLKDFWMVEAFYRVHIAGARP